MVFGAAFYSGLFANISPYTIEAFPVSLGARAAGLAQASNGIGKILGPLCLALIAGSSDVVSPKATADSIAPAFLFIAATEPMRRDSRFMPLVARLQLPQYWRASGHWPDFCSQPGLPYDCKDEAAKLAAPKPSS